MGDRRFDPAYARVRKASDPVAALRLLSDDEVVEALAAASRDLRDPYLANILATEATNRMHRSRAITRYMADGIVSVDAQDRIQSMNPAAERMLGWRREELLGKPRHDTLHRCESAVQMAREACPVFRTIATGQVAESEEDLFERSDGSCFAVSFTSAPIENDGERIGAIIAFRDVSKRRAAERERARWLTLVEAFYRLHDSFGEGLVLTRGSQLEYANDAFRSMMRENLDELRARPDILDVVAPELREHVGREASALFAASGAMIRYTTRLVRRDGTSLPIEVSANVLPPLAGGEPGAAATVVALVRPIAED